MRSIAHSGPAAVAGPAPARKATDKGSIRVTEMVRTDAQSQKLQSFFETATQAGAGSSAAAAVALSSVPRKRKTMMQPALFATQDEDMQDSEQQHRTASQSGASTSTGVLGKLQRDIMNDRDEGEVHALIVIYFRSLCFMLCCTGLCCTGLCCSSLQLQYCAGLKQRLQSSVYVGMVDTSRLLVQHDTDLLLLNIGNLGHDLFYQLVRATILVLSKYVGYSKQIPLIRSGRYVHIAKYVCLC